MKNTAGNLASYIPQDNQTAYRQPFVQTTNEENFQEYLEQIWNKVMLLTEVAVIVNESDKFSYAYRFAELALEKVCKENASLQTRIRELTTAIR
jgi:hypothetical protein